MIEVGRVGEEIEKGATLEVMCEGSAERNGSSIHGIWTMEIVPATGENDRGKTPVYRKSTLRPLKLRTMQGLCAFALSLGLEACIFPLVKGEKATWRKPNEG